MDLGGVASTVHKCVPPGLGGRSRGEHAGLMSDVSLLRDAFGAGHCPGKKKAFVWSRAKSGRVLAQPGWGAQGGAPGGGQGEGRERCLLQESPPP